MAWTMRVMVVMGRDEGLCILNGRVGVVDRGCCWCICCVFELAFSSIVSVLISNYCFWLFFGVVG
jgi:hypothetical protein